MSGLVRKMFNGGTPDTTIPSGINSSVLSIAVQDGTGWPDGSGGPFNAVIDPGLSTEEKIIVTLRSGTTLTVQTRGVDNTAATSHNANAIIRHTLFAEDVDAFNLGASSFIAKVAAKGDLIVGGGAQATVRLPLGASGLVPVVDTTQASGFSYAQPTPGVHDHSTNLLGANIPESSVTGLVDDLANRADLTTAANHYAASSGVHGVVGSVVGTSDAQALSNKAISASTWAGGTLTSPAITSPTETGGTYAAPTITDPTLRPSIAANKGVIVKAQASQVGNLLEFQDSTGALLSGFDAAGRRIYNIPSQDVQITSSVGSIGASTVDIVTLASITGDGTTKVKITAYAASYTTAGALGDRLSLTIQEGATILQTQICEINENPGTFQSKGEFSIVITPSVGAHTYKLSGIRSTGGSMFTVGASATAPTFIRLEQFS
jgi:hypothetical protein